MIINKWLHEHFDLDGEKIGWLCFVPNDFQHNNGVFITWKPSESLIRESRVTPITKRNFLVISIYLAVRHCIEATWLNDRDQFLFPNDGWETDFEFQADCLIFTLFNGQNRISCTQGTNYWIPFTEEQVRSKNAFKSDFMSKFLKDFFDGKVVSILRHGLVTTSSTAAPSLFDENCKIDSSASPQDATLQKGGGVEVEFASQASRGNLSPLEGVASNEVRARGRVSLLSKEAKSVYDAGLELWRYYHTKPLAMPDASFYDIRKYFQGETAGRMNSDSNDEHYSELVADLRSKMKALAAKIEPKVYEFEFLK